MKHVLMLLVLAFITSCAAQVENSSAQDLAALAAPQLGDEFDIFYVPSSGGIADATFVSLSKGSPSGMSQQLAETLGQATDKDVSIVVGGPNSAKTRVVVEGALQVLSGQDLTHLKLMFVGLADDVTAVNELVNSSGGEFYSAGSQP